MTCGDWLEALGSLFELLGVAWVIVVVVITWRKVAAGRSFWAEMWARVRRPKATGVNVSIDAAFAALATMTARATVRPGPDAPLEEHVAALLKQVQSLEGEFDTANREHKEAIKGAQSAAETAMKQVDALRQEITERQSAVQIEDVLWAVPGLGLSLLGAFLQLVAAFVS